MDQTQPPRASFRKAHPGFFWGITTLVLLFLAGAAAVASRVPEYREDAAELSARMTAQERATRDRVLNSRARRSDLAIALLQRELRIKQLSQKGLHLALDTKDSTLYLRNGHATLRQVRVAIGPDSTVQGPNGQTWRMVTALGERRLTEKQTDPVYTVPEWVYASKGRPVPPERERRIAGALGAYVLRLDDGTEIYSEPSSGPFAGTVKPASFMVKGHDLAAIFDAIKTDTPVYIY
jgi:hypothetical protein